MKWQNIIAYGSIAALSVTIWYFIVFYLIDWWSK